MLTAKLLAAPLLPVARHLHARDRAREAAIRELQRYLWKVRGIQLASLKAVAKAI